MHGSDRMLQGTIVGGMEYAADDFSIVSPDVEPPNRFPFFVKIYKNNTGVDEYICGGAIVNENMVMTAAHCLWDLTHSRFYNTLDLWVSTGDFTMSLEDETETAKKYPVHFMRYHGMFKGYRKNGYNFAFLYLKGKINFDANRQFIKLCSNESLTRKLEGEIYNQNRHKFSPPLKEILKSLVKSMSTGRVKPMSNF
ncbi:coagulation factor IX-like isoform X2 [Convolutriloba macropyga]|uniref:coagulation factor IX-like isoform X2 n=1 Tax=Convolutriloba macropyga TaxID=536237 RepID=UPI003F51F1C7